MFIIIERRKLIFFVGRCARLLCTSFSNYRQFDGNIHKFSCCHNWKFLSKCNAFPFHLNAQSTFSVLKSSVCQIHPSRSSRIENIKEALISEFEYSQEEVKEVAEYLSTHISLESDIIKSLTVLKRNGFGRECIQFLPKIPSYNSFYLSSAIECLKLLHDNLKDVLPLLCISYSKLKKIIQSSQKCEYYPEDGKIKWLSQLFQCDVYYLCEKLVRYPEVLMIPPENILNMVELLKDGGIPPHYIVNDMKCLFFREETLQLRIEVLKKNGITNIKPWVLGCVQKNFERAIRRRIASRNVMGNYKTNLEYLAARLNCEENRIPVIFQNIPQVKHMSVTKLKRVLDYLYDEGYTPEDVCKMPRVLTRSLDTLKSRIKELHILKCEQINLSTLCKTKREYAVYLKRLKL